MNVRRRKPNGRSWNARSIGRSHGRAAKVNINNAKWKRDFSPIDAETDSYASQNFSKAYLAHLFNSNEILGLTLATMHNVAFYEWLVAEARQHIIAGSFPEWSIKFIERYNVVEVGSRGL